MTMARSTPPASNHESFQEAPRSDPQTCARKAWIFLVYPCLVLQYMGQAAALCVRPWLPSEGWGAPGLDCSGQHLAAGGWEVSHGVGLARLSLGNTTEISGSKARCLKPGSTGAFGTESSSVEDSRSSTKFGEVLTSLVEPPTSPYRSGRFRQIRPKRIEDWPTFPNFADIVLKAG